ncbi:MAG: thiamin biosynthesis lipoprotein ApbE [Candidatus Moranbacteria bacterium GW2011_GWE1_35_17]|nr:MAG: thiamin biosynthesis lipoprotein ApbE [Candidatus Moranbacteria bacterium GW2011_GWE1_35_17]KKP81569.1 MAG: thiamin biosynthesis lipoprotein ApbE [Candidatus Moranbacteria bacterium GW2011_GWF1_35_5]KKP83866.1 MAG: thiamin biosynthesis lipoprotein ApbE [Candidatus Moranbacteria bacterium GW2011_GWF2_35_54]
MEENIFEENFKALGTDIYIGIIAPKEEAQKVLATFAEVKNIYKRKELIFSRFNLGSELSKLNNNLGVFQEGSDDIIYLAQESLDYYLKSDKFFDPRILEGLEGIGYRKNFKENVFDTKDGFSTEIFKKDLAQDLIISGGKVKFLRKIDFSGIAKGYITDKVAEFLFSRGWRSFLVDSGGDMHASGLNKRGEKWGIALEESENENEIATEISNEGIATSGNTRKYWEIDGKKFHHLINPKNVDEFSFDLKSVTVIAGTTQEADVMAKVLFLMGLEKGLKFSNENGIKSIFLKNNKKIIKSKRLV